MKGTSNITQLTCSCFDRVRMPPTCPAQENRKLLLVHMPCPILDPLSIPKGVEDRRCSEAVRSRIPARYPQSQSFSQDSNPSSQSFQRLSTLATSCCAYVTIQYYVPDWGMSAPRAVPSHDTIEHAKLNTPLVSRLLFRGRASSQ